MGVPTPHATMAKNPAQYIPYLLVAVAVSARHEKSATNNRGGLARSLSRADSESVGVTSLVYRLIKTAAVVRVRILCVRLRLRRVRPTRPTLLLLPLHHRVGTRARVR